MLIECFKCRSKHSIWTKSTEVSTAGFQPICVNRYLPWINPWYHDPPDKIFKWQFLDHILISRIKWVQNCPSPRVQRCPRIQSCPRVQSCPKKSPSIRFSSWPRRTRPFLARWEFQASKVDHEIREGAYQILIFNRPGVLAPKLWESCILTPGPQKLKGHSWNYTDTWA